ncbi:MAG: hypothetical protein ACKOSS_10750 [Planctomycetia bacterium]
MLPPQRRVEGTWAWWGLVLALGVGVALVLGRLRGEVRHMHVQEEAALAAARDLLRVELEHRRQAGRFAGLEELAQAGRLPAPPARHAGGPVLEVPGYTLHVLLPTGTNAAGEVLLAPPPALGDPLLGARHVAIVARPRVPGQDGYRAWYVDEEGRVFLQEGVSDVEALDESPFPRVRLPALNTKSGSGAAWNALESLKSRP